MINQAGIDLIKEFEGFRAAAYQDTGGVWTIGYGTTAAAGLGLVPVPGMTITEPEAEWYLKQGVALFAKKIQPHITAPINENQFAAFVSLAYNVGPNAFIGSTALRRFNAGDIAGAAEAITWWNKDNGKVLRGLVRRRQAERALFLKPVTPQAQGLWGTILAFIRAILTGGKA